MSDMQMSSSTIRTLKDEFLEEYEPMTSLYWKKNKKPNIDIRVSPFALDRQLEDQKFSMIHNRNPRGFELTKGQKLRSEKFVKQGDPSALNTKAKVINKIVREVSGVHTYTLVPPIVKRDKRVKEVVDPDTHPMMKPYRDESTRNPIMCSFGHRPSSASRTFHPSTMNFRLQHEEVAAVAGRGKNGFGLQPAVLAKLLHAPHLSSAEGDDSQSQGSTRPPSGWEDPHDLFLPSASSSSGDLFNKTAASSSMSEDGGNLGHGGNLEHSKSWNATSFTQNDEGDFNGTNSFAQNSSRRSKPKKKEIEKDNRLDASGWNNHFQVMARSANENFELRKSGIAELKLMPLKERLTRYASLSVQESRPDPFCVEKKMTDALLLSGQTAPSRQVFDLQANPFFDAEVNEDVKNIQRSHVRQVEEKRKQIQHKRFMTDLKTIPKCDYHPDQSVLNMHRRTDEELAMQQSENDSQNQVEFQNVGDLYNTLTPPKKDHLEEKKPRKAKKGSRKKGNPTEEKIRFFAHTYMGEDLDAESSLLSSKKDKKKKTSKPKYNIDQVFDHVMQPFDDYLRDEDEYEEGDVNVEEKNVDVDVEEEKSLEEEEMDVEVEEEGSDITDMLQEQHQEGQKTGFLDEAYDYSNMGGDDDHDHDHDLHYTEEEDEAGAGAEGGHYEHEHDEDEEHEGEHTADMNNDTEKHDNAVDNVEQEQEQEQEHVVEQEDEEQKQRDDQQEEHTEDQQPLTNESDEENTFVNQQYHDEDDGGGNNEQEDQDQELDQEQEQQNEEDDLLDNPHAEEQQEYVDNDDNEEGNFDHNDNNDQHDEEEEEEKEEGGHHVTAEEEDQENYDDQKLDFDNEELDDGGMFIEHQY